MDLIECCKKCPNKKINENFCYNGRPMDDCSSYRDYGKTEIANNPPKDIKDMLRY